MNDYFHDIMDILMCSWIKSYLVIALFNKNFI